MRGQFFAGMRSTQWCEKMNYFLSQYWTDKMQLLEFVRRFDLAIAYFHHSENKETHETEDTMPVLKTKITRIETHASQVYTWRMFFMVRKHLVRQGLLISKGTIDVGEVRDFRFHKYDEMTEEVCCGIEEG